MRHSLFSPLPWADGGFCCAHADPPWGFRSNSLKRPGRNAMRHYPCLSPKQIALLPLESVMAKDAFCFLWIPGPFLAVGDHIPVMRAWGFEPTALAFVWTKLNRNAPQLVFSRRDFFLGPGLTTRKNCEFCVLGKRGRPQRLAMDVHELIVAPIREHSRKPDEVYCRIERFCTGPRLDLFGRASRAGWIVWGDEPTRFDPPREAPAILGLEAAE
jgi:N6-adenosine-specific RNA methylase IME4